VRSSRVGVCLLPDWIPRLAGDPSAALALETRAARGAVQLEIDRADSPCR
jgi:hypothetical protein